MFPALNPIDASDQVREAIEEMILTGKLKPGDRLHQENLAKLFGVSRTIILKALHRMESDLLIQNKPRCGLFVRQFNQQEIIEFFECRIGIESAAVRLAARKISDAEVSELRRLFRPFQGSTLLDPFKFNRAKRAFHNRILDISNHPLLSRLTILGNLLVLVGTEPWDPPERELASFLDIIHALESRDEESAVSAMREHLEKNLRQFKKSAYGKEEPAPANQPEMEPADELPIEIL